MIDTGLIAKFIKQLPAKKKEWWYITVWARWVDDDVQLDDLRVYSENDKKKIEKRRKTISEIMHFAVGLIVGWVISVIVLFSVVELTNWR